MQYKHWQGPDRPVSNGAPVTRLELEANEHAPALARAALEPFSAELDLDLVERATLLISEIVTNAVRHSGGSKVRLDIWRSGESLAVVTSDDGLGVDVVARPRAIGGADIDGGFGLPLIDTLSERWGSGAGADSFVWFEVSPRILSRPTATHATDGDQLLDIRMVVESVRNHALIALDRAGNVTNWGAGP